MTTQDRKNAAEGRFNKKFLAGTPTVNDSDIRDLIKRYPLDPLKDEEPTVAAPDESASNNAKAKVRKSFHPFFADHYKQVH